MMKAPAMTTIHTATALTRPNQQEIEAFMQRMRVGGQQATETMNPEYRGLDTKPNVAVLDAFLEGQVRSIAAVYEARQQLDVAAQAMVERLQPDGRIIYTGAGTSGRIGGLDGMELGPTFDWPDDRVVFAMAEDPEFRTGTSRDGLEDNVELAVQKAQALHLGPHDVVIALAASGTTPYTRRFAQEARKAGALVIGMANNPAAPLFGDVDHAVLLETGAEVIAGSTRMGAGTAQKSALTTLSSLVMSKLQGIHGMYDGVMVNMRQPPNAKLNKRAVGIISEIAGCDKEVATAALTACGGIMKPAILMVKGVPTREAAEALLVTHGNNLREAMASLGPERFIGDGSASHPRIAGGESASVAAR